MVLSANLKKVMRDQDVTHNELAVALDVPQSTIRNWREGRNLPKPNNMVKLATYFGFNSTLFLTERMPS